jgi:hypothetical protein
MKVPTNDATVVMGEIMHQELVWYVKCDRKLLFNIVWSFLFYMVLMAIEASGYWCLWYDTENGVLVLLGV